MFTKIAIDKEIDRTFGMTNRCNGLMGKQNNDLLVMVSNLKSDYNNWWERNMPVEDMQLQLDLFASTIVTYKGKETNALAMFFDEALNRINYLVARIPDAFADSRTGGDILMPDGRPYIEYLTPAWYYTVEESGRIVVSGPVNWV